MTDAELAIAVAEEGAAVVRRCFGSTLQRLDKGGGDFATNADVEAEKAMLALLTRERSGDAILGEETGRTGSQDGSRTWFIDPLCGTLNYAAHFAAGLALCEAAGCVVTDLRGAAWGNGATGLLAAADASTHHVLLALVRKYL